VFRRSPATGAAHGSKVALVLIASLAPSKPVVLPQASGAPGIARPRLRRRHLGRLGPALPRPRLRGEYELLADGTSRQIRVGLSEIWLVARAALFFLNRERFISQ
jgi:hypothetical protein